jgi:D-alanyl-D-alanine carboxypeptidase
MLASALALILLMLPLASSWPPIVRAEASSSPPLSSLALRLRLESSAVARDETGSAVAIFGIPAHEARMLLLAVDRQRALPDGYVPPDLTWVGGRQVRAVIRPDLVAMMAAAEKDRVEIAPISVYRSPDEQQMAFESGIWQAMARAGDIDRAEAERRTTRFVAPPGHSQHQLGTAVDFSSWEVNYAVQPKFAETDAARWLEQNAWQYGFVLSYSRTGEERSGYAYEPWHYRWVGRDLAAVLQRDNYLDHPTLIVDDYLRATEEILSAENLP